MSSAIRTFRAGSMDEALDLVRRELGSSAVVVESKTIATRRLLPWPSSRNEIEVSARPVAINAEPVATRTSEPKRSVTPRIVRTLAEVDSIRKSLLASVDRPPVPRRTVGAGIKSLQWIDDRLQQNRFLPGEETDANRQLVTSGSTAIGSGLSTGRRCRTIMICGGKGGVGRSVIAVNLATALALKGDAVGLLDASPDFGNIELLCGLNGYWNLSHVFHGCRTLDDVLQTGPAGIRILSGGNALLNVRNSPTRLTDTLTGRLQSFERDLDWLIVDGSSSVCGITREMMMTADDVVILTNDQPTAVAEAYATVKTLANTAGPRTGLLVNQSDSPQQSQQILDRLQHAAHSFLGFELHSYGYLPSDNAVPNSVQTQIPFVIGSPQSPVTQSLRQLALTWARTPSNSGRAGFFSGLISHSHRTALDEGEAT